MVLFGITGDLARKMILPALYRLTARGELSVPIIGVARSVRDRATLDKHIASAVQDAVPDADRAALEAFSARVQLVAGDYGDPDTFRRLAAAVHSAAGSDPFGVYYLAVPPDLFGAVVDNLAAAGLTGRGRLVVEKPFGHDLASARALNARIRRHVDEDQLFRVDHYLGKEPVEDLLVLRFANTLLEPLWNRTWVRGIEITMAEAFDVADRGSFYDAVGTVRDVVQNHLLQVLAYLTMEPPVSDDADAQRDGRGHLLQAVRTVDPAQAVFGRYDGYLDTPGVAPDSTTETFVALTLHIDNWRWADVPIRVRAGKCLPTTALEVVVELQQPPRRLFVDAAGGAPGPNLVRLRVQPDAGLTFELLAKEPGPGDRTAPLPVSVDFRSVLGEMHAPYERIFADAIAGDPTHFARMDTLEEAWRIVGPVLDERTEPPLTYPRGSWGPDVAAARLGWHAPLG
nr:glucose-6-phosphate dehydrogenase [Pseudonocardia acidicola]